MKDFTYAGINFKVDEDWFGKVKVSPEGDMAEQIYIQAMSDPERSGICTDDPAFDQAIGETKELVEQAKDVNVRHRDKHADVRVCMEAPGTFTIRFAGGQIYKAAVSLKEAKRAIENLDKFLDHNNVVKVFFVKTEGSPLAQAMALEVFMNNKCHRVIATAPVMEQGETTGYMVTFIPKGFDNEEW